MKLTGQQRLILALFLAAGTMFVYSTVFAPKKKEAPATAETSATAAAETAAAVTGETAASSGETAGTTAGETAATAATAPPTPDAGKAKAVKTGVRATVKTPLYAATFEDGGLVALSLSKYPPDPDLVIFTRLAEADRPLFAPLVTAGPQARWEVNRPELVVGRGESAELVFTLRDGERVAARTTFLFHGGDYEVAARAVGARAQDPVVLALGSFIKHDDDPKDVRDISFDALVDRDKVREKLSGKTGTKTFRGDIPWAAFRSKYFILAAITPQGEELTVKRAKNETVAGTYRLRRGGDFTIYLGPKDYRRLKQYGVGLERTVDLGFSVIGIIAALMLRFMYVINGVVKNYGLTIIIFSILIKLLTYYPTALSLKSSQKMQEIQPVLKQLREQYKGDSQRQNAEMMALYKKYKINPLGGCLPMLIQIPIFWGLFSALRNAIELKGTPFFLWIKDLSQPDVLFTFPFTIPLVNIHSLNILPLLMTGAMLAQNTLTLPGKGGVKSEQQKMMTFLPIIFAFLFYNMPSGLVLYWTVNTVLTVVQQLIMRRPGRPPKETAA